jgi:exodeoxyribonuclease VII small subunit
MTTEPDAPLDDLTYEQAREELVTVVQRLETGGVGLEESLALWERGEQLAAVCQRWLDGARERLDRAAQGDGSTEDDEGQDSEAR